MRPGLHPACAAFPMLPEKDLQELAADIKLNGLRDPITLTPDGLLLDGKVRWDCCEIAGIEPRTIVYDGSDPAGFVLSKNKHRRHLTKSQMAMIVAELVNLAPGSNQYQLKGVVVLKKNNHSAHVLSKSGGVPLSYTNYGRTVLRKATPHIAAMVRDGRVNVRVAAEAVRTKDREIQAGWSENDVARAGRKVIMGYPCHQPNGSPPKAKSAPVRTPDIPHKAMVWPTREEVGFPPDGSSVAEYDAFYKKYGRTPLHPKAIKEMLDADGLSSSLAISINSITNDRLPDAEKLFECLDLMLTHIPEPGKTNGAQTDFAAKGRKTRAMLERCLPKALALLTAIDAKLKERKADRGQPAAQDRPLASEQVH